MTSQDHTQTVGGEAEPFTMPIQDPKLPGPFVWEPTEADRRTARSNHSQTLERLAERGGMSWCEMAAIILNRPHQRMDQAYAKAVCRDVLLNRKEYGVNIRPHRVPVEFDEATLPDTTGVSDEVPGLPPENPSRIT